MRFQVVGDALRKDLMRGFIRVAETVTMEAPGEAAAAGQPLSATSEVGSDSEATQEQDGGANAA